MNVQLNTIIDEPNLYSEDGSEELNDPTGKCENTEENGVTVVALLSLGPDFL